VGPGFSSVYKVFVFPLIQFVRNVKRKFSGQHIHLFTSHFCFRDIPGPAGIDGRQEQILSSINGRKRGPGTLQDIWKPLEVSH